MCAETAFREMELSNNLLNQLMPPHIHKAVRVGRPYGESCEVCAGERERVGVLFSCLCRGIVVLDLECFLLVIG